MSRQLTALEKRRITGTSDPVEQLGTFQRLGIHATPRNPTGRHIIECIAYAEQVRACMTALQWDAIKDENIGIGLGQWTQKTSRKPTSTAPSQSAIIGFI